MDTTETCYYLSAHTYTCLVDSQFVFLDLRNDKYLCLDPEKSRVMRELLDDDAVADQIIKSNVVAGNEARGQLVDLLLERGLLTRNQDQGKAIAAVEPCIPTVDLRNTDPDIQIPIGFMDVFRLMKASMLSAARLRWLPLERVIRGVERKKQKVRRKKPPSATPAPQKSKAEQVKERVQVFNRLRPLLYTAKNQCLYDALVLIEFLSAYGIYPDWVFGVKMGPFSAHCWVQEGNTVFNDSVAHTAFHTPIMVV